MDLCPCGSKQNYKDCCGPVIAGTKSAETAEQLMRSRYSAYVKKEIGWLRSSLHPSHRADFNEATTREWAERAEWLGLEILNTVKGGPADADGKVEFIATFNESGTRQEHREIATFQKVNGAWYFKDGKPQSGTTVKHETPKTGRNDPCTCGSGKKYKKCCGA